MHLISAAREVVGLGGTPFGDPASKGDALSQEDEKNISLSQWQKDALQHLGVVEGGGVTVGGVGFVKLVGAVRVIVAKEPRQIGLLQGGDGGKGLDFASCGALHRGLKAGVGVEDGRISIDPVVEREALMTLLGVTVCAISQAS